jgi:hypothetical protein
MVVRVRIRGQAREGLCDHESKGDWNRGGTVSDGGNWGGAYRDYRGQRDNRISSVADGGQGVPWQLSAQSPAESEYSYYGQLLDGPLS